jgi:hypothetical protein
VVPRICYGSRRIHYGQGRTLVAGRQLGTAVSVNRCRLYRWDIRQATADGPEPGSWTSTRDCASALWSGDLGFVLEGRVADVFHQILLEVEHRGHVWREGVRGTGFSQSRGLHVV